MSSVGSYLRELRERRGVSLEEIARATRVARPYLESLEADDFAALPASVFTKGFIRAFCQVLGEPPDEVLARYAGRSIEGRDPVTPVAGPPPRAGRALETEGRGRGAVLVSFILLVVLGVALFAVTLLLQSGREEPGERRAAVTPRAARPPEFKPETAPAPEPPVARPPATPALPETARPPGASAPELRGEARVTAGLQAIVGAVTSPYRLVARTTEPTWIRVRMDDGRISEETVGPGQVREWVSNRPFVLTIGNAGGVTFELNGRPLPPLGARGAVIPRLVLPPDGS